MYFVSLRGCQQTLRVFINGNDMITSKSSKQVLVFAALCHHRYKNRRNLWSWFTVLACAPSSVITTKRSLGWWTSVATTSICIDQKGVKQLTTQTVRGTKSILKVYWCMLVYNRKKNGSKMTWRSFSCLCPLQELDLTYSVNIELGCHMAEPWQDCGRGGGFHLNPLMLHLRELDGWI